MNQQVAFHTLSEWEGYDIQARSVIQTELLYITFGIIAGAKLNHRKSTTFPEWCSAIQQCPARMHSHGLFKAFDNLYRS